MPESKIQIGKTAVVKTDAPVSEWWKGKEVKVLAIHGGHSPALCTVSSDEAGVQRLVAFYETELEAL